MQAGSWSAVGPVARVGGALAAAGALLALLTGVGRTSLGMAREHDLPHWLSALDARHQVPPRAELTLAAVVVVLVLTVDVRSVIGFSSFGVLVYYAVANASAWTQAGADRGYPRLVRVVGLVGCVVLAATLPISSVLAGLAVLAVGLLGRALVRARAGH